MSLFALAILECFEGFFFRGVKGGDLPVGRTHARSHLVFSAAFLRLRPTRPGSSHDTTTPTTRPEAGVFLHPKIQSSVPLVAGGTPRIPVLLQNQEKAQELLPKDRQSFIVA